MTTIIARSAESVHWYRAEDGAPQYTVKAKDGSDRSTTLRDARKMNLVPSVTTVLKIMAKPGLDVWKNEQLLLAAMTLPRGLNEPEKDFIARVVADSKQTGKSAAEAGTRIHESIQGHYEGKPTTQHHEHIKGAVNALNELYGAQKWKCETSFSHAELRFGGKCDLHRTIGNTNLKEYGIVLDVKSKEFAEGDKIDTYDEQLMQLAAYRHGLGVPFALCANVFVSRNNPGVVKVVEWSEEDLIRGWAMFQCLLTFWKLKNSFL